MPSYCTGISQPANGTSFAPAALWRSWRGVRCRVAATAAGRYQAEGGRIPGLSCLSVPVAHPGRTVEARAAALATNSHGVVTRGELLAAGVSKEEIRHRL